APPCTRRACTNAALPRGRVACARRAPRDRRTQSCLAKQSTGPGREPRACWRGPAPVTLLRRPSRSTGSAKCRVQTIEQEGSTFDALLVPRAQRGDSGDHSRESRRFVTAELCVLAVYVLSS